MNVVFYLKVRMLGIKKLQAKKPAVDIKYVEKYSLLTCFCRDEVRKWKKWLNRRNSCTASLTA